MTIISATDLSSNHGIRALKFDGTNHDEMDRFIYQCATSAGRACVATRSIDGSYFIGTLKLLIDDYVHTDRNQFGFSIKTEDMFKNSYKILEFKNE